MKICHKYTNEHSIMKPTNTVQKGGKGQEGKCKHNGGGKLVQGILYASMQVS
jgi:hypothetical protein